ncbi:MAG: peptide chain release factor N(5)-glutamine methyltransferase [Anaerolineaceae bacterium]|nr:peptide chain release factor N(5)-glutamine methyltransferase [Anaerolineaceae bacterium]
MTTTINTARPILGQWLAQARKRLAEHEPDAALEARVLACHVLGQTGAWVQTHPEQPLTEAQTEALESMLARLVKGVPLPYLTGRQEFYGLDFIVNDSVLIPRPETELLVERALGWLRTHPERHAAADVGSGSGCIAVTLARHTPNLRVAAVDRSPAALDVARQNARSHGVEARIDFFQADLLDSVPGSFDLVCANLPYIPSTDVDGLAVARHEPRLALDGGPDGLELIRRLLAQLPARLSPGGLALFEIEYRQGQSAAALAQAAIPAARVQILPDLSGLDRILEVTLTPLP